MVKRIMFVCPGGGPIVKRGESKTKLNFKLSSTFHSHNDDDKASRMAYLVFMHRLEDLEDPWILKKRSFGYFCIDVKTQDVYQSTNRLNHIIYEENFAKKLDIIYMCVHQQ